MSEEQTTNPTLTLVEPPGFDVIPLVGHVDPFVSPGVCAELGFHAAGLMCWRCRPSRRDARRRWMFHQWKAQRCKR